jgi:hypothetical protein
VWDKGGKVTIGGAYATSDRHDSLCRLATAAAYEALTEKDLYVAGYFTSETTPVATLYCSRPPCQACLDSCMLDGLDWIVVGDPVAVDAHRLLATLSSDDGEDLWTVRVHRQGTWGFSVHFPAEWGEVFNIEAQQRNG